MEKDFQICKIVKKLDEKAVSTDGNSLFLFLAKQAITDYRIIRF